MLTHACYLTQAVIWLYGKLPYAHQLVLALVINETSEGSIALLPSI